ncbi:DNA adenine methylase [Rathayibacter iranicus]|uniref:site-specific DNA-methyltransferase (adenine-specific) n=2 Tax=Rathayibacter iranicus TaxID=59737 RepID=A0AAD1ELB9_9MICO|nr:DNA adenine methylase [Rathayibacter iranicus]AZZ54942.1 DNA adenine methylase [Rathayibacter iranicus]MWV32459.1 DNA adenine methylase [Rathayibacter iranicus NCPPB 2253 = VKM Ac-1602]PPI62562.1 DNA methyltransferase [Rathayibacter iranicus]PWJ61189.1 DNA adenine methylase [Rathayibacter iranicus] [Rathayibacter iranicus NCPPB 2253 = VKM Ac-1602]
MSSARYVSPLRYTGGKAPMASWLGEMFDRQHSGLPIELWIEPFAGGAGAALTLLNRGAVDEVHLIDANAGIAAFWQAVLADGEDLARRVRLTVPTLDLRHECRALLTAPDDHDLFELGYAAFLINRCSRSGILSPAVGPMGGHAQIGEWTIGARFNSAALAERIRRVHALRNRVTVFVGDGISHVEDLNGSGIEDEVVLFVDPPYLREGNRLYVRGMNGSAHQRFADALHATAARWMLTYGRYRRRQDRIPLRRHRRQRNQAALAAIQEPRSGDPDPDG